MAASSPALSNNSNDTTTTTTTSAAHAVATTTPATTTTGTNSTSVQRSDAPKTLRGLNKPKCIQCGNVARSRCPYQSCKSCCAKAQNPCHIHVLKPNATFPDKSPSSTSPLFDQQSTEVSPSGTSLRVASLRQLSNNFAQFNNVQIPLRSRRPLTRKDAAAINEWRFAKLKEYKDRNIESENEAFDRYMLNISLLEEVCSVKTTLEGPTEDGSPISNPNLTSVEDNTGMTISGLKVKLRSNSIRIDNFRKRIQQIVDQGLRKLQSCELNNGVNDLNDQSEINKRPKKAKTWRAERASALTDLIDKLNKARNEEDLKSCLELKSQLFNRHTRASETRIEDVEIFKERTAKNDLAPRQESNYSLPKLFSTAEIDQETLNCIDVHFSSLEQIEDL